jgi:hypothetical protein
MSEAVAMRVVEENREWGVNLRGNGMLSGLSCGCITCPLWWRKYAAFQDIQCGEAGAIGSDAKGLWAQLRSYQNPTETTPKK